MRERGAIMPKAWRVGGCGALAAIAAGAAACADHQPSRRPLQVDVACNPAADFSDYRSFALPSDEGANRDLLAGLHPAQRSDLQQVNALTAGELRDHGLVAAAADAADLLVVSLARTTGEAYLSWGCIAGVWGGYWYWEDNNDVCAWIEPVSGGAEAGTLMVGLFDPRREQTVWVGFVRNLGGGAGPDDRDRDVASGVARVFARYPSLSTSQSTTCREVLSPDASSIVGLSYFSTRASRRH